MNVPLLGQFVTLRPFIDLNITPEYIGWLNNPVVVRYSNQRFRSHNIETCKTYLSSFENSGNLFFAIYMNSEFVGTMTSYISEIQGTADMGIMIGDPRVWGKGIGKDAWTTLMRYLFEKKRIRKVTGGALRCNTAMVSIMMKSGMKPDGVRVAHELVDGKPEDILHFARFRT